MQAPMPAPSTWLAACCEACGRWTRGRLCSACDGDFARERPRCHRCGLMLAAGPALCGECLADPPPIERCVVAVDYDFPWDRRIRRMKFDSHPEGAALLAELLTRAVRRAHEALPCGVLAVPCSQERRRVRGYDQAWELARRVSRALGVELLASVLDRRFDASPQSRLSRSERLRNLQGAFVLGPAERSRVAGRHLALVDDVMTTGATIRRAAQVLLEGGASRVDAWVVARTAAPTAEPNA